MPKLFIIGNGFDLAHKMETSYDYFKEYLKHYDSNRLYHNYFPAAAASDARRENSAYILWCIVNETVKNKDKWSDFEEALGNINCNYILQLKNSDGMLLFDKYYSYDNHYREDQVEQNYFSYGWSSSRVFRMLPQVFNDWVKDTVDNKMDSIAPKHKFSELIKPDDLFLTFNYTLTLEKVYKVKSCQIYHIHNMVGTNLIFGHGKTDEEICAMAELCEPLFDDGLEILKDLKKPVEFALEKNKDFFDRVGTVDEIYSYGFSYGDVDLPYIDKIITKLPEGCIWHINEHKSNGISDYEKSKQKVINCGFKGMIDNNFKI